jgi:hypothetical protein
MHQVFETTHQTPLIRSSTIISTIQAPRYHQPSNVKMSPSTVNNTPVNTTTTKAKTPVNQIAGSTQYAKEGCNS